MKRIWIFIVGGVIIVALLGYLIYSLFAKSVTLTVWTVQGNEDAIKQVAQVYQNQHKLNRVNIVPLPAQAFEYKSLYALAAQKGPDVWILPDNEWMTLHRNKLIPAPDGELDKAIQGYQQKRAKDETPPSWPAKGRSNVQVITQDYAPAVQNDLIKDNQVWGVPINMDTLAMFYDKTQISTPPKTWKDLIDETKHFTLRQGTTITRSTIALGDNESVNHSVDILSELMLQNGTQMVDEKSGLATFNISLTGVTPPGTNALDYYTSFDRPDKETYTWNKSLGTSLQALKDGKTLMAVGYLSDLSAVGPIGTTRIGVAPLPQVDPNKPQSYGHYMVATVTKQASTPERSQAAWDFVSLFANPDISQQYATSLRQVPAREDVAQRMTLGPQYIPFLEQVPLANNWRKQEVAVANQGLGNAIQTVDYDNQKPQEALDTASKAYTSFLQKPTGINTDPQVITFWQSTDDSDDYSSAINDFVIQTKNLKRFVITKHDPARYEWEALNAMAARQGPDAILIPNDQVNHFAATLRQFPTNYFNLSGGRTDEVTALKREFVPAVVTDNVINGHLYALPIAIETLEIAYNRQLFHQLEQESLKDPNSPYNAKEELFHQGPLLWKDLEAMTTIATKRSGSSLQLPFIAIGSGQNAVHSPDLFATLVKQFGGDLTDPDRLVAGFHLPADSGVPGQEAQDLIKSFSDPSSDHYTWNATQPNSLQAFTDGKVMAVLAYPRDLVKVQKQNPDIQIGTFPLPQTSIVGKATDYASYYSLGIPLGGKRPNDVITFLYQAVFGTIGGGDYIGPTQRSNQPSGIQDRQGISSPQVIQVNTAQSYYKGLYPQETDQAILDLLDGKINLEQAANRVNLSLKRTIL